jgi:transketolase
MRVTFTKWFESYCQSQYAQKEIFLTGDLGFNAFESLQHILGDRFINAGVSEQNMVTMAAAMAHEGLTPTCYSIAPFLLYRALEQIKVDVCLHHKNVKLVGNGGGYGYGIMGPTHHALEDYGIMSTLPNMVCYIPFSDECIPFVCEEMFKRNGPSYLRLGNGMRPKTLPFREQNNYRPCFKISEGDSITILGVGPVLLNAIKALEELQLVHVADFFVQYEIPQFNLSQEFIESLKKTKKLLIIEEHGSRGSVSEMVALELFKLNTNTNTNINLSLNLNSFRHLNSQQYPSRLYGSQSFHQKESGLDCETIKKNILEMLG